jgi:acetylornithine deacetylase/succinyl-diaminopimelate desuccinylase-like protein
MRPSRSFPWPVHLRPACAALLVLSPCLGADLTPAPAPPRPDRPSLVEQVKAYVRAHGADIVREYAAFLSLPNLATNEKAIRANAQHIVTLLGRRGIAARLLDGHGGPPAVFGEIDAGASKTLALYAHYDGQPVEPEKWTSPPWTPVLRDGPLGPSARTIDIGALSGPIDGEWRLFARSASDDKAPIFAIAEALDALRAAGLRPAVNLKLFFEGEEERGSPHLRSVLESNRELLRADAWLLCDGPVHQSRRMQVYFGARGVTDVELTLYGPARAVHSGHYGNWVPNPAVALAHLVAGLRDLDGRVAIPGFYDDVRPETPAERAALAAVPDVDDALRDELALAVTEAGGARLVERLMLPALNLRGLAAGAVGAKAKNAIPTEARASIDFRLVPDQTPARIRELLEAHLRAQGFTVVHEEPSLEDRRRTPNLVRLEWGEGYPAARTAMDLPFSRRLVTVLGEGQGAPIVALPTLGGSIPMYLFVEIFGTPVVGLPIVNHDNSQHAADENLRLQNLWDGIGSFAMVFSGMGRGW